MKLYRIIVMLMVSMVILVGCTETDESDKSSDAPPSEEMPEVADESKTVPEKPEMDRERITNRVYTIPRENPYSTGFKVISTEENALMNGDFEHGQAPWQINTVDGVVFDGGLIVEDQGSERQHVILVQSVKGLEKMKTYNILVEASAESQIPIVFKIRDIENNAVYARTEVIIDSESKSYEVRLPMNYELADGAVFEVDIETIASDSLHIHQISLTRDLGTLVWSDEFDLKGLADSEKWGYDVGGTGWGNEEAQTYMVSDPDNTFVEDGSLHIRAVEEEFQSTRFTSARLITRDIYETKYKRIEIKVKLPDGIGTWPAIWMLPSNNDYGQWPSSGEIDILEHVGFDPDIVHGTVHTEKYNHMENTQKSGVIYVPDGRNAYHRYTIDWTPYEIDFYVDDYLYFTYDNDGTGPASWPFDQEFYLLLSLAVGGTWGGQQGIDSAAFPAEMLVDYVRIYELPIESVDTQAPETVRDIEVHVGGTLATVYWQQSKDDYLLDHYEVYLDDKLVGTTAKRAYTFYTLTASSSYSVGIVAVDAAGNRSDLFTTGFKTEESVALAIGGIIQGEAALHNVGGEIHSTEAATIVDQLDEGDYLVYELKAADSGNYNVTLAVSSLKNKGAVSVAIDGIKAIGAVELPSNGSWTTIEEVNLGWVYLEEGNHFMTLTTERSGFAVDYLMVH